MSAFTISCVFVVAISINNFNTSKADEDPYAINFSSSKNVLNSGTSPDTSSTIVKSEKNTSFIFDYSNVVSCSNKWQKVNKDGFFYSGFQNNLNSINNNRFCDMKIASFVFSEENLPFTLIFSYDEIFDNKHEWSRTYKTTIGTQVLDFEGHPNYFKFVASSDIEITSLTITYGCNSSNDNIWEKTHGLVPIFSQDRKTLTYGLYPQTFVKDNYLIAILRNKATTLGVQNEEYFWFNDEYYVKDTGNPYGSYTFSDGTTPVNSGDTYFFKCEPITWDIVEKKNNYYVLDCSNILYAHRYSEMFSLYANSELRTWLTGSFYKKTFFLNNINIVPTDLEDASLGNEKVWVGSKSEYSKWYSKEPDRTKKVSDFALCNNAFMSTYKEYTRNGWYWTRSPFTDSGELDLELELTYFINEYGRFSLISTNFAHYGCSPSLTINYSEE